MRQRPLSASSIKTFLLCALQYYYKYEDKKPRGGRTDPLSFGTAVHEALECLHTRVSESGAPPTTEDYEAVLSTFMHSATSGGLSDLALYQEGKEMLLARLDNIDHTEKIVGLELKFELETPNGTPFLGSIDKLIELDHETAVIGQCFNGGMGNRGARPQHQHRQGGRRNRNDIFIFVDKGDSLGLLFQPAMLQIKIAQAIAQLG